MSETVLPTQTNVVEPNDGLTDEFVYVTQPDFTYKLNVGAARVNGYVDKLEAYAQALYLILNTERYEYAIYSWNYGIELNDLIGSHIAFAVPMIQQRVTEALMQDDRTISVDGYTYDTSKRGVVDVSFTVTSIYGSIEIEKSVRIS